MVMTNFLQKRKTVRDYKSNALDAVTLKEVRDILAQVEAQENSEVLNFAFFENGKIIADGLEGKAGYGGVMIHAPHYISLEVNSTDEAELVRTGYFLEKVNTALVEKDLGTCWITVDQVDDATKRNLFGEGGENVQYLIGFGIPQGKKLFSKETSTPRLTLDKFVFKNHFDTPATPEELEQLGLMDLFSSVRFAPSHMNSQPWRFLLNDAKVTLYMLRSDWDHRSLVDIGVIMHYVEEMLASMGNTAKWELIDEADKDGMKAVARITI